jgi:uncharacterized membrane protein
MVDMSTANCVNKDYSLTPEAMKRLRFYSAMAVIGFPIFSVVGMWDWLDDFNKPIQFIVSLLLLMSFLPLVSNRIYNRLSRHQGRLDEREKDTMRRAQAFSYKFIVILLLILILVGLASLGLMDLDFRTPYFSVSIIAITAMNLVFIMLFLPITYIAWTEKPLDDEVM